MMKPMDVATGIQDQGSAFGCPRDFLGNRFVYAVISAQTGGLALEINVNPDKRCNFDCVYCEVDRDEPSAEPALDVPVMQQELQRALALVYSDELRRQPGYEHLSAELLQLRQVSLSGDGEPTLCPNFAEVVQAVIHLRARGQFPFFKVVLITNATGLDRPEVIHGIRQLAARDEVWAKLDAGTQDYLRRISRSDCRLDELCARILSLARTRPIVVQSLFPSWQGEGVPPAEIDAFVERLRQLKSAGARIARVQISSAAPVPARSCGHLPLRGLLNIARRVREGCGLETHVF